MTEQEAARWKSRQAVSMILIGKGHFVQMRTARLIRPMVQVPLNVTANPEHLVIIL